MKTTKLYLLGSTIALMSILYACKKDNNNNNTTSSADLQTQSDDQTQVSNENDAVIDDVNNVLSSNMTVTGSNAPGYIHHITTDGADTVTSYICDAVIVLDTTASTHTLTITYNGSNCAVTRTRSGKVVVSWPADQEWRTKGAVVTVSIQDLKITRIRDGKSITLNGTHTYTNVSGGSLSDVPKGSPVTHTVTSDDMSITFDNGSKRSWHVARQRVYSWVNQGLLITLTGMHTDGNNSGISEWGTNRWGNSFVTEITSPLTIDQNCSFRLTAGAVEIIRPEVTTNITFGLDATGAATGCPGEGSYYFKLIWADAAGKTYTFILPY